METIQKVGSSPMHTGSLTTYLILKCKQCTNELHVDQEMKYISNVFLCYYCKAMITL